MNVQVNKQRKLNGTMNLYLDNYNNSLFMLCQKNRVKSLYAFGSVLTDKFSNDSDIDLIVTFNDMPVEDYIDNYFDFKYSLQDIFNRHVDLLEEQAIKNPYFMKNINQSKLLIYG